MKKIFKKLVPIIFSAGSILPISASLNDGSVSVEKDLDFSNARLERSLAIKKERNELTNAHNSNEAARAIVSRYIGNDINRVSFGEIPKTIQNNKEYDVYSYQVKNNHLYIEGSSPVAMVHGWYDWLTENGYGMIGWEEENIQIPPRLVDQVKKTTISPYQKHYYFNSATAGYSTPWWNADKWMDNISWLAIHGYDLVLDYVGYEAIAKRLYKNIGLKDNDINDFFNGPAYATWGRLGNISGVDKNPYIDKWNTKQIQLQHDILNMMGKIGMTPIPASFAGFVPKELGKVPGFEGINLAQTHWDGFPSKPSYMINPYDQDPRDKSKNLFSSLEEEFVNLYEQEFGPQDFYLVDSFEEMTPPSINPSGFVNNVANKTYEGIHNATSNHKNGGASWVFQGWMLGFQRNIWSYPTFHEFLKDIPNDKVLIIDEAEDYNSTFWFNGPNYNYFKSPQNGESFDGKRWVYSTIPNMGGNTATTGDLKWYANSGPDALNTKNHGNLYAYGSAPEGIDNNPVTQELISEMGWRTSNVDITTWLKKYSINRYAFWNSDFDKYWKLRLDSANSYLDDHPIYYFQYTPIASWTAPSSDTWLDALEKFADIAKTLNSNEATNLFKDDLYRNVAQYVGILLDRIIRSTNYYDPNEVAINQQKINAMYDYMDRILASHNTDRLSRWIKYARYWGDTPEEKLYYEQDAKRHLTIWSPSLHDYAAKTWSGLIGSYYEARLNAYMDSIRGGGAINSWNISDLFSEPWVKRELTSNDYATPFLNPYAKAIDIVDTYKITRTKDQSYPDATTTLITPARKPSLGYAQYTFQLSTDQLRKLDKITIGQIDNAHFNRNSDLLIKHIKLLSGPYVLLDKDTSITIPNQKEITISFPKFDEKQILSSNNGASLELTFYSSQRTETEVKVFINKLGILKSDVNI